MTLRGMPLVVKGYKSTFSWEEVMDLMEYISYSGSSVFMLGELSHRTSREMIILKG